MIRLAIADDFTLHREGLRCLLETHPDILVVGEAADGTAAVDLTRKENPDVLLLETAMPGKDGLDAIKEIVAHGLRSRILAMTMQGTAHLVLRLMRAGAHGVILRRTCGFKDLLGAIGLVRAGRTYLPPEIRQTFAERYYRTGAGEDPTEQLSDREFQVARFLASGYTNQEIAERLCISIKTVDTHRANILRKLGLRNNSDITRFAICQRLISCEIPVEDSVSTPEAETSEDF
ncbi:MAG TPA: response regulator transcription factor [Thermoanaerobaculia bacterium]|nr:response regulator transcription factor [Thermoanaerobaculia bacterium]